MAIMPIYRQSMDVMHRGDTYEEVLPKIQEVLHLILEEDGAERGNKPAESIQNFTI